MIYGFRRPHSWKYLCGYLLRDLLEAFEKRAEGNRMKLKITWLAPICGNAAIPPMPSLSAYQLSCLPHLCSRAYAWCCQTSKLCGVDKLNHSASYKSSSKAATLVQSLAWPTVIKKLEGRPLFMRSHPVKAAAWCDQAAMAVRCDCQFHGRSSSSRLAGWSAILVRISANQACGSTSLSGAVWMSV